MNADLFAEWLRRQGHRVLRTASSYWTNQGPHTYQAFPYHWVIMPSDDELLRFMRHHRAVGLRYSAPLEGLVGSPSYHAVYEGPSYGYGSLGKWARKNVRRGLRNCSVEPLAFERLADEGWALQVDTLDRQGRRLEVTREAWSQRCLSAVGLPGFEAWGALVNGRLAASVITFQMDDCCYMLYQQSLREYLSEHVNNALSFVVTRTMMNRTDIRSVLYGLHSLDAPASVDRFKFRMGYAAKPVRQRVVFHPWLRPLVNGASYTMLGRLLRWRPGNPILAKAEGMVRFYLEGKRPLQVQNWPEPLCDRRTTSPRRGF